MRCIENAIEQAPLTIDIWLIEQIEQTIVKLVHLIMIILNYSLELNKTRISCDHLHSLNQVIELPDLILSKLSI